MFMVVSVKMYGCHATNARNALVKCMEGAGLASNGCVARYALSVDMHLPVHYNVMYM